MKKVLIIPSWYPSVSNPGKGIFFLEQARLLSSNFDIRILCGTRKAKISRWKKIFNTLFFLIFHKCSWERKTGYFNEPPDVFGFEFECGLNILKKMNYKITTEVYVEVFTNMYKHWIPDIIHAHDINPGGIAAMLISERSQIPFALTEHNYLRLDNTGFVRNDIIKTIQKADRILVVSDYILRNNLMLGFNGRFEVTGNMADDSIFYLAQKAIPDSKFRILYIGRDSIEKDMPTLFRTILEYYKRSHDKNFCFRIVGNCTSLQNTIIEQSGELIERKMIEFTQYADRETLVGIIQSSDVLISTSISESFGLAMCEAMMCGIPVISTDSGGFDELHVPGINGIKVRIGDYKAIADALLSIKRGEITFNSILIRDSVIEKFGKKAFASRLSEIYNSINA